MSKKKITKTVRMDDVLERRVKSYAEAKGVRESDAIRSLLEQGLACEGLSVFATPVGALIRDVIEAELVLFREELDDHERRTEERLARVCSRGTKAALHVAVQLNDLSRALVPVWRETPAKELWDAYSRAGGEIQAGVSYAEAKDRLR